MLIMELTWLCSYDHLIFICLCCQCLLPPNMSLKVKMNIHELDHNPQKIQLIIVTLSNSDK